MHAEVGDRLLVGHGVHRTGLVIALTNSDGTPPYIIKWLSDSHIAMVFPDQYSRIVPAGHPVGTGPAGPRLPGPSSPSTCAPPSKA